MKGIPVSGFHEYVGDKASMLIKLAGWIPLVRLQDGALFPTETVTYFNDLCLFAPAALIDERIEWEAIDGHTARALFRNKGATIHADLTFNQEGQLIHFVSPDRVEVNENRKIPFSTPVGEYKMYSGFKLPGYGEGVWNYPEGDFTYGKFTVISVEYNLSGIP